MASNNDLRAVTVERVNPLDSTMCSVTFAPLDDGVSPGERFHGGHCRFMFPDPRGSGACRTRSFTYRRWHPDGSFDVDFAVHNGTGPASSWLRNARPGSRLAWRHGGPPKISLDRPDDGLSILVGDLTGLPVVCALAERAHPNRMISLLLAGSRGVRPKLHIENTR